MRTRSESRCCHGSIASPSALSPRREAAAPAEPPRVSSRVSSLRVSSSRVSSPLSSPFLSAPPVSPVGWEALGPRGWAWEVPGAASGSWRRSSPRRRPWSAPRDSVSRRPAAGARRGISTSTPSATVAIAFCPAASMSRTPPEPFPRAITMTREPTPSTGGPFGADGFRASANDGNRGPCGSDIRTSWGVGLTRAPAARRPVPARWWSRLLAPRPGA